MEYRSGPAGRSSYVPMNSVFDLLAGMGPGKPNYAASQFLSISMHTIHVRNDLVFGGWLNKMHPAAAAPRKIPPPSLSRKRNEKETNAGWGGGKFLRVPGAQSPFVSLFRQHQFNKGLYCTGG